jgi:hypothetical protein
MAKRGRYDIREDSMAVDYDDSESDSDSEDYGQNEPDFKRVKLYMEANVGDFHYLTPQVQALIIHHVIRYRIAEDMGALIDLGSTDKTLRALTKEVIAEQFARLLRLMTRIILEGDLRSRIDISVLHCMCYELRGNLRFSASGLMRLYWPDRPALTEAQRAAIFTPDLLVNDAAKLLSVKTRLEDPAFLPKLYLFLDGMGLDKPSDMSYWHYYVLLNKNDVNLPDTDYLYKWTQVEPVDAIMAFFLYSDRGSPKPMGPIVYAMIQKWNAGSGLVLDEEVIKSVGRLLGYYFRVHSGPVAPYDISPSILKQDPRSPCTIPSRLHFIRDIQTFATLLLTTHERTGLLAFIPHRDTVSPADLPFITHLAQLPYLPGQQPATARQWTDVFDQEALFKRSTRELLELLLALEKLPPELAYIYSSDMERAVVSHMNLGALTQYEVASFLAGPWDRVKQRLTFLNGDNKTEGGIWEIIEALSERDDTDWDEVWALKSVVMNPAEHEREKLYVIPLDTGSGGESEDESIEEVEVNHTLLKKLLEHHEWGNWTTTLEALVRSGRLDLTYTRNLLTVQNLYHYIVDYRARHDPEPLILDAISLRVRYFLPHKEGLRFNTYLFDTLMVAAKKKESAENDPFLVDGSHRFLRTVELLELFQKIVPNMGSPWKIIPGMRQMPYMYPVLIKYWFLPLMVWYGRHDQDYVDEPVDLWEQGFDTMLSYTHEDDLSIFYSMIVCLQHVDQWDTSFFRGTSDDIFQAWENFWERGRGRGDKKTHRLVTEAVRLVFVHIHEIRDLLVDNPRILQSLLNSDPSVATMTAHEWFEHFGLLQVSISKSVIDIDEAHEDFHEYLRDTFYPQWPAYNGSDAMEI